jgi:two-component system nitrate/nitrite response regulator NarL
LPTWEHVRNFLLDADRLAPDRRLTILPKFALAACQGDKSMVAESLFLIESNRLFREGLRRMLSEWSLPVVHESSSHESSSIAEALSFVKSLQPSLVLFDQPNGGEALAQMKSLHAAAPRARLVVLTDDIRADRLTDALSIGVNGYLLKKMSGDALLQSLRLVLLGEKVFPTDLAHLLVDGRVVARGDASRIGHVNGLTDREMQILACLLKGASNKQIAHELEISDGTVKLHLKGILKKIQVQNRTQAALWALDRGIGAARMSRPWSGRDRPAPAR